ncbi:MAG: bifunctional riboflavin kinase/FAD synthetase [Chlorobiota bacterium]|nr:bifunctional riboflavin kinase/FAD synthetase [Chlorobiota bacterium]QQS66615.1 MAG: bifunctional riboflavin kinase/FAD synthetase [Chlorobiota bacterium]
MKTIDQISFDKNSVITIGTFDGVHLGHKLIIEELLKKASEHAARSVVVTFYPHPQDVLRTKGDSVKLLTSQDEKEIYLNSFGVDEIVIIDFDSETANTPWQDFCDLLRNQIGVSHIVFGHDHAFGKNRKGNIENIKEYGKINNFTVSEVPPLSINNETVSSTKIRNYLNNNEIIKANILLGYNYSIIGLVTKGDGRGRKLGFPTANIKPLDEKKLLPSNGVYAVNIWVNGVAYRAMMNIGVRPTFTNGIEKTIEANIFNFDKEIYSSVIKVEFLKFVRLEQKFTSSEEFLIQLAKDQVACLGA